MANLWRLAREWFLKFLPPPPPIFPDDIPDDIIYNILVRLPVKSVGRFRCVCREWNKLLNGLEFIKEHLDYNPHHRLILPSLDYYISMDLEAPSSSVVTSLDHFPWNRYIIFILGSCNGLLCTQVGYNIFLWNPCTRKYKKLAPPSGFISFSMFYGFGHDMSIGKYYNYKVVRGRGNTVEVYTRKTNSWRRIQDSPYRMIDRARGIFSYGFLHWLAMDKDDRHIIASLDLAKEEFGEVMLPDFREPCFMLELGILNGMLCVLCSNSTRGTWDVYALREYGVPESWFILITMPPILGRTQPRPFSGTFLGMPLYLMKNGELVMQIQLSKISIHDPRKGTFENPIDVELNVETITYVESLESP